jgi:hypothetical protein
MVSLYSLESQDISLPNHFLFGSTRATDPEGNHDWKATKSLVVSKQTFQL